MHTNNTISQQPEQGSTKGIPGSGQEKRPASWIADVKFLGSLAAIVSTLVYAVGYLCHLGHQKMLGISQIENTTDRIIQDGVMFCFLWPIFVFISLFVSWLSVILLLVVLRMILRSLRERFQAPLSQIVNIVTKRYLPLTVTTCVVLHAVYFFLAATIQSQRELLLTEQHEVPAGISAVLFRVITSHCPELPRLLGTGDCYCLYGLLFLLCIACLLPWSKLILVSFRRSESSISTARGSILTRVLLSVSVFFVILLLIIQALFYGFLCKSNEYPVIRVDETSNQSLPAGIAGEDLFVLGHNKSRTLLYSENNRKIWWVLDYHYLPASRSKTAQKLFSEFENEECVQGKNQDTASFE